MARHQTEHLEHWAEATRVATFGQKAKLTPSNQVFIISRGNEQGRAVNLSLARSLSLPDWKVSRQDRALDRTDNSLMLYRHVYSRGVPILTPAGNASPSCSQNFLRTLSSLLFTLFSVKVAGAILSLKEVLGGDTWDKYNWGWEERVYLLLKRVCSQQAHNH